MRFNKVDPKSYKKTQWAFGETTELYIFPHDADYTSRRFKWRVSMATVHTEKSTFTPLYGVRRWILSLDHGLVLKHYSNGTPLYDIQLKAFEPHCFKGDWDTECFGMASDFNLMLKEDAQGRLMTKVIYQGEEKPIPELVKEFAEPICFPEDFALTMGFFSTGSHYEVGDTHIRENELLLVTGDEEALKTLRVKNIGPQESPLIIFLVASIV